MTSTIMIDGYNLGLEKGTGVATYGRNLSREIHALGYRTEVLYGANASSGPDPLLREVSFFDMGQPNASRLTRFIRRSRVLATSPLGRKAVEIPLTGAVVSKGLQSRLPYFDALWNSPNVFDIGYDHFRRYDTLLQVKGLTTPAVMHWTYPVPVTVPGAKNIYTLHDLVPLRLPYTTGDVKRRYLRLARKIVAEADHIVTVSETSRRDIINLLDCPEEKVTNTYQSVEIPAKFADKPEDMLRREVEGAFGLPFRGYYLFFGAIEPKKNVAGLIESYLSSQVAAPLVIVGSPSFRAETELRFIGAAQASYTASVDSPRDRIRRFDYAPFSLLVSLIRGAKAVVFPSLYEGFGLPVLEAMLLGTPVITSTEGSTPEVAGEAAVLVDPYDNGALTEAIRTVEADADLRGRLSEAGRAQAAKFSPEAYRRRLADLYGRLT